MMNANLNKVNACSMNSQVSSQPNQITNYFQEVKPNKPHVNPAELISLLKVPSHSPPAIAHNLPMVANFLQKSPIQLNQVNQVNQMNQMNPSQMSMLPPPSTTHWGSSPDHPSIFDHASLVKNPRFKPPLMNFSNSSQMLLNNISKPSCSNNGPALLNNFSNFFQQNLQEIITAINNGSFTPGQTDNKDIEPSLKPEMLIPLRYKFI